MFTATATETFRFDKLAEQFNSAMNSIGSNLYFGADGTPIANGPMSPRDWKIISFWFGAMRVLDDLELAKSKEPSRSERKFPTWVFTMHPNIIWNLKSRRALIHVYRYCERKEYEGILGVIVDLFHGNARDAITKGGRITVMEYAQLWIDTVGSSIFKVSDELYQGQLLTWMSVDCDGSDPAHVNSRVIGKTCQLFMNWTLGKYQSFIRHYRDEADLLCNRIHDSLEATKSGVYDKQLRPNAYQSPEKFLKDLEELRKQVEPHDQKKIQRFMRKVECLGFSGLEFQPRINSASVWTTLQAIAQRNGLEAEETSTKLLKTLSSADELKFDNLGNETADWILDVIAGYREIFSRTNRLASAVVANTQNLSDLKAAELLFKLTGLGWLDVIPLQEDREGMRPATVRACAKHVRQVSMCGFSDTPRNSGATQGTITLMRSNETIADHGKIPYFGRAHHPIRGGGQLEHFLQVMGSPEKFVSLRQGDDVFFDCVAPELALESLAPSYERLPASEMPELLIKIGKRVEREFRFLVEDEGFNQLWDRVSGLTKGLVVTARPSNRSSDGSSGGQGWETSRAIGAVQTSLAVLAYYPHIFGTGKVFTKYKEELRELYQSADPHVRFLIQTLKRLIPQVRIDHFSRLAADFVCPEVIQRCGADFWELRNAIRFITDDQSFRSGDPLEIIKMAYEGVGVLAKKTNRSNTENDMLAAMLHCVLSYYKTSG